MAASFRDIKDQVRTRITRGDWGPGTLLPSELVLADSFGCARATVNRALRELAEEGLLDRRRKSGTRVIASPRRQARFDIPLIRDDVIDRGAQYRYALVRRNEANAPDWLLARMGLAEGTRVLHLLAMHYADGAPFVHEDRWISLTALPQARSANFTAVGPNEWLVATIPFSEAEIAFSAQPAGPDLARYLGCHQTEALFRLERTTWLDAVPVTYVTMTYQPGYRMTTRY